MALGPLVTLLAPEPVARVWSPADRGSLARLRHAVWEPLREFLTRPRRRRRSSPSSLLFKLGEAMAGMMTAPFYRSLGFDRAAVALATGFPSLAATFAGTALGGWLVARSGSAARCISTGWAQTASMALYFALADSAGDVTMLLTKVVTEAFAEGMADAAFITYLSGLCSIAFTATQYALLSSLAAVALRTVGGLSGFLAAMARLGAFLRADHLRRAARDADHAAPPAPLPRAGREISPQARLNRRPDASRLLPPLARTDRHPRPAAVRQRGAARLAAGLGLSPVLRALRQRAGRLAATHRPGIARRADALAASPPISARATGPSSSRSCSASPDGSC